MIPLLCIFFWLSQGFFASPIVSNRSSLFGTSISSDELEKRSTWRPDYTLHMTSEYITLSCVQERLVLVNGQHPGPLLRFQEGETTWVRVYNHLKASREVTSTLFAMHWHGLDGDGMMWHDGTPESQFMIQPGYFRDYAITPPRGSAGSYLYHDHAMSFAASTATGPIIVEPAKGEQIPYHYDDERIVFLSDVFDKTDAEIEHGLTTVPFSFSGEARKILVNGKGYGFSRTIWSANNPTVKTETCQIEVLRVSANKSYRFYFISGTAMTFVTIAMQPDDQKLQKTPLQVIEADGEYTQPYYTDRISIGSGQRYSAILSKETLQAYRGKGGFWLEGREVNRAHLQPILIRIEVEDSDNTDDDQSSPRDEDEKWKELLSSKAVFRADDSFLDIKIQPRVRDDMPLRPLHGYKGVFPTSEEVTATIFLSGKDVEEYHQLPQNDRSSGFIYSRDLEEDDQVGLSVHWELGGDSYMGPLNGMPRLVAIKTDQQQFCPNPAVYNSPQYPQHYDKDHKIYAFEKGAVIDIILLNMPPMHANAYPNRKLRASDSHPFHLHGAHYFDLGAGKGDYSGFQGKSQEKSERDSLMKSRIKSQIEENTENGKILRRDTSMLYFYGEAEYAEDVDGWRAIRIKVESLGVWLLHCHMLQHMLMGMGVALAFGRPDDIRGLPKPQLNGWDSNEARNVFHTEDKNAKATSTVAVGVAFANIKTDEENLGETLLSQGRFGVKANAIELGELTND